MSRHALLVRVVLAASLTAPAVAPAQSPPAVTGYVTVDRSRLYYEECGSGVSAAPPIVLVHDGLMGAASWDLVWPALCARGHVLRYDRRGVGRSSEPAVAFSQVADLEALLRDRGMARATIVGSSSGGAISLEYALAHPERVERLVLLGPVVNGVGYSQHFVRRERHNIEPLLRGDIQGAIQNQIADPFALAPGDTAVRRRVRAALAASPQNLSNLLVTGRLEERPAVPAGARLGEVGVPTLIVVGEHDIPDVHAHAGVIESGVASARREVVSGGGHLVQLDHPDVIAARILAFVAETPIVRVPEARLRAVAGTYAPFASDRPGRFLVRGGRLVVRVAGSREVVLFPSSDSTFFAVTTGTQFQVTFRRGANGRVDAADLDFGTATRHARAIRRRR